ncbi:MAG: class I SAM-dependent DNA methyltransferase [Candidatus Heimdallarchaeaceae archaeon]|jgi:SAM-dependent methyltransferase
MKIYLDYAWAYHEMYQVIFDYDREFKMYDKILSKLKCKRILEIGCGSGNLASRFINQGYDYTGLDISEQMLEISRKLVPEGNFILGDMRNLNFQEKFECILVTGRTFTHMTTNNDVMKALTSIHQALDENGWLVFDNFNADVIFRNFKEGMVHKSKSGNRKYTRESKTSLLLDHGWTWKWNAHYKIEEDEKIEEFDDEIILRAFTESDLSLFLAMNGFETKEFRKEESAILTIAQKEVESPLIQNLYFKK